jgi:hypothetical protein
MGLYLHTPYFFMTFCAIWQRQLLPLEHNFCMNFPFNMEMSLSVNSVACVVGLNNCECGTLYFFVKEWYQCHIQNFEECISEYCILACFLGNATRDCVGLGSGRICLLDNHALHSLIQLFALITPSDVFSSTVIYSAPLFLVECLGFSFFEARLTPALVGYELTGSKSKSKSHCDWRSVSQ